MYLLTIALDFKKPLINFSNRASLNIDHQQHYKFISYHSTDKKYYTKALFGRLKGKKHVTNDDYY